MNNLDTPEFGMMTAIIICLGLFAMIFGIVYLAKRERMAMLERGIDPRKYKPRTMQYHTLRWGLLLIGAGIGLFLAYTLDRTLFSRTEDDNVAIYFALIAVFGGLGLFASFKMEKKELEKNGQE